MELLDIYNENREKTGRIHKRGNKVEEGDYSLVVHLWIKNDKGEILIQKRQSTKKIFPNMWDASVAGAAMQGDDSKSAIIRETKEELGIDLELDKLELLLSVKRDWWFDDIWIVKQNIHINDLEIQHEEVADAKWATYDEIDIMIQKGEFIKYDYIERIKKY
ncbi:MAG: NUDIX hydrolase [Clostridium sp.]